jgi:CHAT domain-containing protein/tetratricopeptide (TPR) repeat protein
MRRQEDHIESDELSNLLESLEALDAGGPDEKQIAQHLKQCQDCLELAMTHWKLKSFSINAQSSPGEPCPEQIVWLEWAAALRPDEASALLAHATKCVRCAVFMREAMDLMNESQVEPEIQGLESGSAEWQNRVAAQMAGVQNKPAKPALRVLSVFQQRPRWAGWTAIPAAAVLLVGAVLLSITVWNSSHASDAKLLALAYNKQRRLVLRIPGGDPVPMASGTRASRASLPEPTELLELRLRAQKHLDEKSNTAYWQQILGEISLLEKDKDPDGSIALNNLEEAQSANEHLPNLTADLAAAQFEIAEKQHSSKAYGDAIHLYTSAIGDNPANPSLLYYNRALCWSRLGMNEEALQDFKSALSTEKSVEWRKAIEEEIERLSKHSGIEKYPSPNGAGSTTDSPAGDGYETMLANATEELLPRWNDSQEVREKLAHISEVGALHSDRWLQDWIATPHTSASQPADSALAEAVRAGVAGNARDSLAKSREALKLYRRAANWPGQLRAQLAVTYALQRLDRAQDCMNAAVALDRELGNREYAWIRTQLALEEADCHGIAGDFDRAQRAFLQSLDLSSKSELVLLHLRALGSQALLLNLTGRPIRGWQMSIEGIRVCAAVDCPPIRKYQLLYNLAYGAEQLDLPDVAAEVMTAASRVAAHTGDVTTYAYALETLASMEGRSGQFDSSTHEFNEATTVMRSGAPSTFTGLYQAEWETDRAEILLRQGKKAEALALLEQSEPGFQKSDYKVGKLRFLAELAAIQLSMNETPAALTSAWEVVGLAERSLPSLRGALARERWQHENSFAYAQLVKAFLQCGKNSEALEAWERFRRVPYSMAAEPLGTLAAAPAFLESGTIASDARVLVIARLEDEYVAWLATAPPVRVLRTVTIENGSQLRKLAATFYRLCADRDSSVEDIRQVGSQIYAALLSPFADQLGSSDELRFDVDPSLAILPLPAIPCPGGGWLGLSRQLNVLPAWWTAHPAELWVSHPIKLAGNVIVVDGFGEKDRITGRTSYSESAEIAGLFPHAKLIDGGAVEAESLIQSLVSADALHFSGHASAASGSQLLLSPDGNSPSKVLSAEAFDSIRLHRCRIAVLAACNTTGANPHRTPESDDLREAILRSGAHSVIASTWEVDDRSTHALMLSLYKGLIRGVSPGESLLAAQKAVRSIADWQHPYYWASFESFTN